MGSFKQDRDGKFVGDQCYLLKTHFRIKKPELLLKYVFIECNLSLPENAC